MEVAQVLDEMVPPCEALLAHARAVLDRAGEVGLAHAVHCRLVPLQVGEPSEIGGRCAIRNLAFPSAVDMLALWSSIGTSSVIEGSCKAKPLSWVGGSHTVDSLAWQKLAE
jgi:hypothetical protein